MNKYHLDFIWKNTILIKWLIKPGDFIKNNQRILEVEFSHGKRILKFVWDEEGDGIVKELLYKPNQIIRSGTVLFSFSWCAHALIWNKMCTACCRKITQESNQYVNLGLVGPYKNIAIEDGFVVNKSTISEPIQQKETLNLILDLDLTLIHSIDGDFSDVKGTHSILDGTMTVAIRPNTLEFLEKCCKLFNLYIYTHGNRQYASAVLKVLDPNQFFFGDRIMSIDDEPANTKRRKVTINKKNLANLGNNVLETNSIIVDDSYVWKNSDNLILAKPFVFWGKPNKNDQYLMKILPILENLAKNSNSNVKETLIKLKKNVLAKICVKLINFDNYRNLYCALIKKYGGIVSENENFVNYIICGDNYKLSTNNHKYICVSWLIHSVQYLKLMDIENYKDFTNSKAYRNNYAERMQERLL